MRMSIMQSLSQKAELMMNRILEWFLNVPIDPLHVTPTTPLSRRQAKGRDANDS